MELINVMEAITLVVTLAMFMTGFVPCMHMYKTKSTENIPFHVFVMMAISCSGMFHYGLILGNGTLIFLNAVGGVLQCLYVVLYLKVVDPKTKSVLLLCGGIAYISVLYGYLFKVAVEPAKIADTLGMCCGLLNTFVMCLPALEVVGNLRHKNAEGTPPIMLIGGIACSICWLIYGILLEDPNVYVPNIPGIFITSVKLCIIGVYGGSKTDVKKHKKHE